jgi:nucleoside-diphosphate-sugar epimerase
MASLLITGIEGFTGRYLADLAKAAGFKVVGTIYSLPDSGICPEGWHVCDITDPIAVTELIKTLRPDAVAHLAGISSVMHGNAEMIYRTNILGTRNLLEALVASNMKPDTVLLASSANIYGNASSGILDENTPPAPANDYAVSKLAMEYMAKLYTGRLNINIVRPFNYTGVRQSTDFLIPKIVDHIKRRAPFIELGNLDVARDFSDVRMVVAYYLKLLQKPQSSGSVFNVCSGKAYTLNEVLDMARRISGHDFEVKVNPEFVRANDVKVLIGDKRILDAAVGEVDAIPLVETLGWMISD